MAYLLCIETSGPICSVALYSDKRTLVGFLQDGNNFQHAAVLTTLIDQLLKESQLTPRDVSAVALSAGPGSYTGLRIGTSVAKGFCYALDIPMIAIDTLSILAYGLTVEHRIGTENVICPVIDARRMEVYSATFMGDLTLVDSAKPKIIDENSYKKELEEGLVHFIGSGAKKIAETIKHDNLRYFGDDVLSAKYMGPLAYERLESHAFEDIAYFEPFYLKAFHTTAKI